jgi:hypothetical protein
VISCGQQFLRRLRLLVACIVLNVAVAPAAVRVEAMQPVTAALFVAQRGAAPPVAAAFPRSRAAGEIGQTRGVVRQGLPSAPSRWLVSAPVPEAPARDGRYLYLSHRALLC